MTRLFKTIKIPREIKDETTNNGTRHTTPQEENMRCEECGFTPSNCYCDDEEEEECEHEDMEYEDCESEFIEEGCVVQEARLTCLNCDYWVLERHEAPIGDFEYIDTIDSGY